MTATSFAPRPATLSTNARTVLEKRYLQRNAQGQPIETPEDLFWRVAGVIAEVDRRYGADDAEVERTRGEFYALMTDGRFEPNSPTLTGAGRGHGQLSACFVLPVADALSNGHDGIYDTLTSMALIHQSGGGTGFSFSRLRARGAMVKSSSGVASGPVSFMKLYDSSTEAVKQGGTRRGANMGILRVDHPDILEFIHCKDDLSEMTNFNISVAVTRAFMDAVRRDGTYDLIAPETQDVVGNLRARDVWTQMIDGAWRTGEPGVVFIDEANRYNPVPHLGSYEATNPCGEQILLPYDVCNLGSVNVGVYVQAGVMQWDLLGEDIRRAVHFLDNVIDANRFPLPEIDQLSKRIRRIGLGVMGFADALIKLGIRYDSPEGVEFGRRVMEFLDVEGKAQSEIMAKQRGAFPEWAQSIWGPDETCARDVNGERIRPMQLLRNCNVTTVAPTGTISIIAGCSSGLEPLFAVAFMRNQAGVMMPDVNEDFVAIAKQGGWYSDELVERIAKTGTINHPEVPAKVKDVFRTANEIPAEWHIRMQSAFQQHCDSAISKTTNFAHTATVDDVRTIYEMAYEMHCKGVTVYRDGSRDGQVLSTGATAEATSHRVAASPEDVANLNERITELEREKRELEERACRAEGEHLAPRAKRVRPGKLRGTTYRKETPLGVMFINITEDAQGQPFEVFINLGKAGGSAMADAEALGRVISLALRSGIPLMQIHKQIRGISSDRAVGFGAQKVLSMPDAVAIALAEWYAERTHGVQASLPMLSVPVGHAASPSGAELAPVFAFAAAAHEPYYDAHGACPDCGAGKVYSGGCVECSVRCGWSECG
ncbi:MAG: vitamin B12-dependent ribonucleotide reductase [Gemmatimonadaceae bacterium]|nr:vitamin B12-dependent ribonucleotide reductase [Gemmatimonadaceae bacterium]